MTDKEFKELVKNMRGLQVRHNKARTTGQVKAAKLLAEELIKLETAVDEALMAYFYTPQQEQSNLFK